MVRLVEGQIVDDDDDDASGWGILGRVMRFRAGTTMNLVGFRVPLFWACLLFLFFFLRFGPQGLLLMGAVAGEKKRNGVHRRIVVDRHPLVMKRSGGILCPIQTGCRKKALYFNTSCTLVAKATH